MTILTNKEWLKQRDDYRNEERVRIRSLDRDDTLNEIAMQLFDIREALSDIASAIINHR
jgi:hypothetical protein